MNKPIMIATMVAAWAFIPYAQAQCAGESCPYGGGSGFGSMMGFGAGPFGILGMILGLVFWLLLIIAIVYLIRYVIRSGGAGIIPGSSAMTILNERYAKGELSKSEYEEMKKELEKSGS